MNELVWVLAAAKGTASTGINKWLNFNFVFQHKHSPFLLFACVSQTASRHFLNSSLLLEARSVCLEGAAMLTHVPLVFS